jgi:hypothetical protein
MTLRVRRKRKVRSRAFLALLLAVAASMLLAAAAIRDQEAPPATLDQVLQETNPEVMPVLDVARMYKARGNRAKAATVYERIRRLVVEQVRRDGCRDRERGLLRALDAEIDELE